jgi:hypothetical protein
VAGQKLALIKICDFFFYTKEWESKKFDPHSFAYQNRNNSPKPVAMRLARLNTITDNLLIL